MTSEIIRWAGAGIVILIQLVLLLNLLTNKDSKLQRLIKDISAQEKIRDASYSYSRTQLLWWSLIIISCLVIDIALTGKVSDILSPGCLTLLGISAGTTVAGRVIDNSQNNDPSVTLHQHTPSEGFWMDILSDQQGISIHRFQAVLFNIAFGLAFISQFITSIPATDIFGSTITLPDFDTTTLGLIGISSATYVTLKFNENLSKKPAAPAPVPTPTPTPAEDPAPEK
jgi:hypothetical protein